MKRLIFLILALVSIAAYGMYRYEGLSTKDMHDIIKKEINTLVEKEDEIEQINKEIEELIIRKKLLERKIDAKNSNHNPPDDKSSLSFTKLLFWLSLHSAHWF